jgi:hypothetical protein
MPERELHLLAFGNPNRAGSWRQRGLFRREYSGTTLRDHLGLDRPANRYVA